MTYYEKLQMYMPEPHKRQLVYIAHPVRPRPDTLETEKLNLQYAESWVRWAIVDCGVLAVAPYLGLCRALNDGDTSERIMGVAVSLRVLRKCDELWLCGPRISEGMRQEAELAEEAGVQIVDLERRRLPGG